EKRESFFSELLKFALVALLIVVPVRFFIAQPFIVSGASMDPTFKTGQYLIVDELTYRLEQPRRGQVIIFRYPKDPTQYFIKRIVGLPGETLSIESGNVYLESAGKGRVKLDEPYIENTGNGSD